MQETTISRLGGQDTPRSQPEAAPQPATTSSADKPVRKLFIRTFGCQMNEYDSAKMADVLGAESTLELTQTPEDE